MAARPRGWLLQIRTRSLLLAKNPRLHRHRAQRLRRPRRQLRHSYIYSDFDADSNFNSYSNACGFTYNDTHTYADDAETYTDSAVSSYPGATFVAFIPLLGREHQADWPLRLPQKRSAFSSACTTNGSTVAAMSVSNRDCSSGLVLPPWQLYRLFKTVRSADLIDSTCSLTFCRPAVSASICFSICSTLRCSFRNSLSSIALIALYRTLSICPVPLRTARFGSTWATSSAISP